MKPDEVLYAHGTNEDSTERHDYDECDGSQDGHVLSGRRRSLKEALALCSLLSELAGISICCAGRWRLVNCNTETKRLRRQRKGRAGERGRVDVKMWIVLHKSRQRILMLHSLRSKEEKHYILRVKGPQRLT